MWNGGIEPVSETRHKNRMKTTIHKTTSPGNGREVLLLSKIGTQLLSTSIVLNVSCFHFHTAHTSLLYTSIVSVSTDKLWGVFGAN